MSDVWGAAVGAVARWRKDIIAFARECCGVEPDDWQKQALVDVQNSPRQATVGSKGTGKTFVQAVGIWWFLFTRPHANIAVTSVSGDNLKDGLWKELALVQHRAPILSAAFEWQQTRIVSRESPATWWVSARQWSKSANAQQQSDTLAGLHADYTMFVLDEAGSIPLAVAVTAEAALASGKECKLLIGGNPTSLDGPLYHAAVTHRHLWRVVTITGDPDRADRSPRVSRDWATQQIESYGRSNPWVMVNVLGQFPPASLNALLGVEEVQAAMRRKLPVDAYSWSQKRLGIDVARYGDDRTVISPRQGLFAGRMVVMRHARGSSVSTDIANRVLAAKAKWGSELEFFDATGGWAAGAVDVMRADGYAPIDVQFSSPAIDRRYANRRAELHFALAEWVKRGGALPMMPELIAELTTPTYSFGRNGQMIIEPKELVKQRLGRSPDMADALALTFGLPEMPQGMASARGSVGKVLTETDPFQ